MWQIISSKFTPFVTIRRMVGRNAAYAAQSSRYISISNYYELIYIYIYIYISNLTHLNAISHAYKYSGKKPYLLYHHVPIYMTPRMTSKLSCYRACICDGMGMGGTEERMVCWIHIFKVIVLPTAHTIVRRAWPKDAERVHNHGYHACSTDRMKAR
jgi:hypothetical protein